MISDSSTTSYRSYELDGRAEKKRLKKIKKVKDEHDKLVKRVNKRIADINKPTPKYKMSASERSNLITSLKQEIKQSNDKTQSTINELTPKNEAYKEFRKVARKYHIENKSNWLKELVFM
eukprot:TRINITY_DN19600_c0_g1_i1.p1 TRINITY_DN19600_c0_g1~~TRINITY_DN19600_c0_g1_i1.p1  ORF type:complete len:120 (-),score=21.11 TRINITY_DN19600_c0_g1_i1:27-386(-)